MLHILHKNQLRKIKNINLRLKARAVQMAQWLWASTNIEELCLVPSTHVGWLTTTWTSSSRGVIISSVVVHSHAHSSTHMHKQESYQQTNKTNIKIYLEKWKTWNYKITKETDEEKSVTLVVEIVYGIQQKISREVKWKQKMGCYPSQVNCYSPLPAFPMNNLTQCYG